MQTQTQHDRQTRRAKRRSEKATKAKKWFRTTGKARRLVAGEKPRELWHPENW